MGLNRRTQRQVGTWCASLLAPCILPLLAAAAETNGPSVAPPPLRSAVSVREGILVLVQREPGAETCPDADTVFRAMEQLFPERAYKRAYVPEQASASARIVIRPSEGGYEARVEVQLPRTGQRLIVERDPSCQGLGDALAVALAMLTDDQGQTGEPGPLPAPEQKPSVTAPPQPTAAPHQPTSTEIPALQHDRKTTPLTAASSSQQRSFVPTVRGAGVGGIGLVSQPMGGARLGIGALHRSGFGFEIGAIGLWASPTTDGLGSIAISRLGAMLDLCREQRFWPRGSLQLCLQIGAGDQRATTANFTQVWQPIRHDRWIGLGPRLGYAHVFAPWLQGAFSLGALANLERDNIVVQGSSAAVKSPIVGLVAEAGLRWIGPGF